jgi:hypothetical protein
MDHGAKCFIKDEQLLIFLFLSRSRRNSPRKTLFRRILPHFTTIIFLVFSGWLPAAPRARASLSGGWLKLSSTLDGSSFSSSMDGRAIPACVILILKLLKWRSASSREGIRSGV